MFLKRVKMVSNYVKMKRMPTLSIFWSSHPHLAKSDRQIDRQRDRSFLKHFAVERLNYVNIYTNIYALNIKLKLQCYKYDKRWNKNESVKTMYSD